MRAENINTKGRKIYLNLELFDMLSNQKETTKIISRRKNSKKLGKNLDSVLSHYQL